MTIGVECESSVSPGDKTTSFESEDETRKIASKLPKVQLHLHVDGSLPEHFIASRANARQIQLPCSADQLRQHLIQMKQNAVSRETFNQQPSSNWDTFTFCNQFLQTSEELAESVQLIISNLIHVHNCKVIELRFCPHLHTLETLTLDQVVQAVTTSLNNTINRENNDIKGGIILCALRSYPSHHINEIFTLAEKYYHKGVIGIDLAGDEFNYPLKNHLASFQNFQNPQQIPMTLHVGESGPSSIENFQLVMDMINKYNIQIKRLGHALVLDKQNHHEMFHTVQRSHIPIELCLTANCTGGRKIKADAFHLHPLSNWVQNHVNIAAFNCDNLLLSGTLKHRPNPTEEIVRARRHCHLSWNQIAQILVQGVKATFTQFSSTAERNQYVHDFEKEVFKCLEDMGVGDCLK